MHKDSIRELILAERQFERNNYVPNPNGFYENPILDYSNGDTDKLVSKVLAQKLSELPTVMGLTYKIAFMIRPDAEILMSARRAWPDNISKIMSVNEALNIISARDDFDATYLNYHDVVVNPTKEFSKLKEAGWPIDVDIAASIPDETLYRNRL
jgi:hypothetical protein